MLQCAYRYRCVCLIDFDSSPGHSYSYTGVGVQARKRHVSVWGRSRIERSCYYLETKREEESPVLSPSNAA